MKIKKIRINNFGHLKNKEIDFKNKINIIYGKNETGKSTLLKYIISMLYGISKNKKGKDISDYDYYMPWEGEGYSGKLTYELDDRSEFEIFRDFNKKSIQIYNNGNEVSKEFNIDKTKGNQYFIDQTKIDQELFLATQIVAQTQVKLDKESENTLIQKISNLISTGEDVTSFKKIMEKLNKRLVEEIGTERTTERPLNQVLDRLNKLKIKKGELIKYNELKYENEKIIKNNEEKIKEIENKMDLIKEIKTINDNNIIEEEKIKVNKEINENNINKIKELNNKKGKIEKNNRRNNNKSFVVITTAALIIINIILIIISMPTTIKAVMIAVTAIIYTIAVMLHHKKSVNQKKMEVTNIKQEIYILERNKIEKEKEIKIIEEKIINENKNKINELKNKYINKINNFEIEEIINLKNINIKIEENQNEINKYILLNHKLELEQENSKIRLEELPNIEEQIQLLEEQYTDLMKKKESMELVKQVLEKSYAKIKQNVTPNLIVNISENIAKISDNKYNNIKFDDEQGLIVELENGSFTSVDRLSIGTIDQLYLSLRLSVLKEATTEELPIILDEAFAYFDNNRLGEMLKHLYEKYNNQILIFTCTKREIEVLEELNVKYNLIELN